MVHTLLLGLGGTGSRTVAKVAQDLKRNNIAINDGVVCCAVIDTDKGDIEKLEQAHITIPVVEMGSQKTLGDIMDSDAEANEWCFAEVPNFRSQTITRGASAYRIKSRLAFLDTCNSMKIKTIDDLISKIIASDDGKKTDIQVMLVSSISGGTGAGMFIETALWIRNLFKGKGYEITLSSMLLLPDVFVQTTREIFDDKDGKTRHYANAYAALREINELERIKLDKDYKPKVPVKVGELFDSENLNDPRFSQRGVFDFIFFIDYQNAAGGSLRSLDEYEDLAAQLTYMQLFAPTISSTIKSKQDNTYLAHLKTKGIWFGSCGSAKAVYPKEDVLEYCILNTISDMVRDGWLQLDSEIEALQQIEKAKIDAGEMVPNKLNPVQKYMELFEDKINKTGVSVGKNTFFRDLKKEVSTSKLTAFLDDLKNMVGKKIDAINTNDKGFSNLNALGIEPGDTSVDAIKDLTSEELSQYSIEILKTTVTDNKTLFEEEKETFDTRTSDILFTSIMNEVFPYIMGDLNMHNTKSVYGLLTHVDEETETRSFVHPVAMRYLLYKLQSMLERKKAEAKTAIANAKTKINNLDATVSFDYGRTKGIKETLENYFEKIPNFWAGGEEPYKQHFIKKYKSYIQQQYALGKEYELNVLHHMVLQELYSRITELIKIIENFFKSLPEINEACDEEIQTNLRKIDEKPLSVTYVCASEKAKQLVYESLGIGFENGNKATNRTVIDTAYGMLCAEKIPGHKDNQKYAECDIVQIFINEIRDFYTNQILNEKLNKIDLDIYEALKKELDSEQDIHDAAPVQKRSVMGGQSPVAAAASSKTEKYVQAMKVLIDKLYNNASPALNYVEDYNQKAFPVWGFNSCLLKSCPSEALAYNAVIGNAQTQADAAFPKNEFCCYRAVYGVDVDHFLKFKEDEKNGIYYKNYCDILDGMDETDEISLMQTTHLDKTWHNTLRYLSKEKQDAEDKRFLRGILYGFAYKRLRIHEGFYEIFRDRGGWTRLCEGEDLVRKAEVADLLRLLMTDGLFLKNDIKALEEEYKKDTTDINDYVGTKIYQYLTTQEEKNPLKLIIGYNNCRACNQEFKNGLIEAIEDILLELINAYDETHFDINRTAATKEKAQTARLLEVYNACDHKDKENVFATWVNKFNA